MVSATNPAHPFVRIAPRNQGIRGEGGIKRDGGFNPLEEHVRDGGMRSEWD